MSCKCDVCGKMAKTYFTVSSGDRVCSKTCINALRLESYLLRMEKNRVRDEPLNKTAYEQARELSAYLSLFRNGNAESKKRAAIEINSFAS